MYIVVVVVVDVDVEVVVVDVVASLAVNVVIADAAIAVGGNLAIVNVVELAIGADADAASISFDTVCIGSTVSLPLSIMPSALRPESLSHFRTA